MRLSIDPGAEYLLPFAKKKLFDLKRLGLSRKVIEVGSGERIYIQAGLVDSIRIEGGVEYFYLTSSPYTRAVLVNNDFPNYCYAGGSWKKLSSVPLYPTPGFEVPLFEHARDSVCRLLSYESFALAAVMINSNFSVAAPIVNGTSHYTYDGTAKDAALYAEIGGSGLNAGLRKFTFDPAWGNAFYLESPKLQSALEPYFGTFSHSVYPIDPTYATGFIGLSGPLSATEGRIIFDRQGPTLVGNTMGLFGRYTVVSARMEQTGSSLETAVGKHYLVSVDEYMFKRTHAGWVNTYWKRQPISYTSSVSRGPYLEYMPPWHDGDVVEEQIALSGTVPVNMISPEFDVPLGNTSFTTAMRFNGVNPWVDSEFEPAFRPSFKFTLLPEWSTSPRPVVGARAVPFSSAYLGIGANGVVDGNIYPASVSGKELSAFICPKTGTRYSEQSDGTLRAQFGDGSPTTTVASGTPAIPLRFFYYPETSNTREFVPADSIPAYIKYSGSARAAFTQLTNLPGPTDELICPYHPYGGFCVYHPRTGGVLFGYWAVSIDDESGPPPFLANYLSDPSSETWEIVRSVLVIQYRHGLPETVAVFARDGNTLIIA